MKVYFLKYPKLEIDLVYRKVLRLTAASKPQILCFVFKFKELRPSTPMFYFFQIERHVFKRRLS